MIPLEEAVRRVLQNVNRLDSAPVPLDQALGHILAEPVRSDIDLPPFNRSAMDGYAVRAADIASVPATLQVIETVAAGQAADRPVGPGCAAKIMTGAPVPSGADAVVMVEKTRPTNDGTGVIVAESVPSGKNIAPKGQDIASGQLALPAGTLIRPEEIGILATVGGARPQVYRRPSVMTLVTGDELIDVAQRPTGAQIRESNGQTLAAQLAGDGLQAEPLGIVRDDRQELERKIEAGLSADILILSGGVSMGDRDFVPPVLAAMGAETVFHKVAIKPGKPVLFARKGNCRIFGLPGNPVSALIVYQLLIRPAIRAMMGYADPIGRRPRAILRGRVPKVIGRRQFLPARLDDSGDALTVELVEWHGSGDLISLQQADGYVTIPEKPATVAEGDRLEVLVRGV